MLILYSSIRETIIHVLEFNIASDDTIYVILEAVFT